MRAAAPATTASLTKARRGGSSPNATHCTLRDRLARQLRTGIKQHLHCRTVTRTRSIVKRRVAAGAWSSAEAQLLCTNSDLTVAVSSRRAPLAPSLCTHVGRCASRRASLSTLPAWAAAQALLANSTSLRLCVAGCGAVQHAHPGSRHAALGLCATLGIRLSHTCSHDTCLWLGWDVEESD